MDDAKIRDLERRISILERTPTNRYLDNQSKDITSQVISDRILDIVWNDYFYYYTGFESEDAWDVVSEASPAVTSGGLTLQTTNTNNNQSYGLRSLGALGSKQITFDQESRFKTSLMFGVDSPSTNVDYSLSIGSGINTSVASHYGFRVESGSLKGISADGTTESEITLMSISGGDGMQVFPYLLEARYFPGKRIDFYVSDSGSDVLKLRGVKTTNLPDIYDTGNISIDLFTRTTDVKQAIVGFVEYIQRKTPR